MSRLYNVRAKLKDKEDEVYGLKIVFPADEEWLWICRKPTQVEPVKQLTEADLDSL